ncbi:hypothetical protein ACFL6S_32150 [Candidatus Poribacteria bacterium]
MREDFHSGSGRLIGYTLLENEDMGRRVACYDSSGAYIGYMDDSGTYDDTGVRISMDRVPGLLFRSAIDDE